MVDDLEKQLRFSEALMTDVQKTPQQKDSELEVLRSKVSSPQLQFLVLQLIDCM